MRRHHYDRVERLINQLLTEQDDNIDSLNKYGIKELRDGLTIEEIKAKYPWILKAKISNVIIGERNGHLVWYNGTWKDGIWEDGYWEYGYWWDGTWESGTWKDGIWHNGIWNNGGTIYNSPKDLTVGRRNDTTDGGRPALGILDEIRLSNIARSAAWLKTSYNSGNDSLVSYGSEEKKAIYIID